MRHHPAVPVWVELRSFGAGGIGAGTGHLLGLDCGEGLHFHLWGGEVFCFSVLFVCWVFLTPPRDQNLWKLGKLGREAPFSFHLGGQLFNPEVK